jgi:hydroxymethylpyrimidine/phosphomethylpyrimidine kinase
MSVITALTAQNTTGVQGVHIVPAEFVRKQIESVMGDITPKCIKTGMVPVGTAVIAGMLATGEIVRCVAEAVRKSGVSCVVDPVR